MANDLISFDNLAVTAPERESKRSCCARTRVVPCAVVGSNVCCRSDDLVATAPQETTTGQPCSFSGRSWPTATSLQFHCWCPMIVGWKSDSNMLPRVVILEKLISMRSNGLLVPRKNYARHDTFWIHRNMSTIAPSGRDTRTRRSHSGLGWPASMTATHHGTSGTTCKEISSPVVRSETGTKKLRRHTWVRCHDFHQSRQFEF